MDPSSFNVMSFHGDCQVMDHDDLDVVYPTFPTQSATALAASESSHQYMSFSSDDNMEHSVPNTPQDSTWSGTSFTGTLTPTTPQSPPSMFPGSQDPHSYSSQSLWHEHSNQLQHCPVPAEVCNAGSVDFPTGFGQLRLSNQWCGPSMGWREVTNPGLIPPSLVTGFSDQVDHLCHLRPAETHLAVSGPRTVAQQNAVCSESDYLPSSPRRSSSRGSERPRRRRQGDSNTEEIHDKEVTIAGTVFRQTVKKVGKRDEKYRCDLPKTVRDGGVVKVMMCGKIFKRPEHLQRHKRSHSQDTDGREFLCPLATYFGAYLCSRGEHKPIRERGDNLTQHASTHCYGYSAHQSRNVEIHPRVMERLIFLVEHLEKDTPLEQKQREVRAQSVLNQLLKQLRKKVEPSKDVDSRTFQPSQESQQFAVRVNSHIDHAEMRKLFPGGFMSCEDVPDGSAGRIRAGAGCLEDLDRDIPWCAAWVKGGPKHTEASKLDLPVRDPEFREILTRIQAAEKQDKRSEFSIAENGGRNKVDAAFRRPAPMVAGLKCKVSKRRASDLRRRGCYPRL